MRKRLSGEMTVFLTLTLMLIASLLLTILEGARYRCLKAEADMDRMLQAYSSFAEYDIALLEKYGLLYLDDSYGTGEESLSRVAGRIKNLSDENLNPKGNGTMTLLRMEMKECSVDQYELATDYDGDAFRRQVVEFTKENITVAAADLLQQAVTEGSTAAENSSFHEGMVEEGEQAMAQAREEQAEEDGEPAEAPPPPPDYEDPFELFHLLSGQALLSLVLPPGRTVSTKRADLSDVTEHRSNHRGNYPTHKGTGLSDEIWFLLYLKQNFGNFTRVLPDKKLDYELEYILCGKDDDLSNLEAVLGRILLFREAINFAYIETDAEKTGIALSIATALAGISANPALIEAVKHGILAAWAYVESLQELRTLLSGGKVPVIKTAENWVTDVLHPATSFGNTQGTASDERGFTYEHYLLQMMMLVGAGTQNYRTMSMMELNIRTLPGKEHFRMDCMIQRMKLGYLYEASPLFLSFVTIGDVSGLQYAFPQEMKISYLSGDG